MKKNKKKTGKKNQGFTIDNSIQSHANDPVFREKARRAKEVMDRVGWPDESLWKK